MTCLEIADVPLFAGTVTLMLKLYSADAPGSPLIAAPFAVVSEFAV